MEGSTTSSVYPVSDLAKAASSAGVDSTKWKKCFDTKETSALFDTETSEAQSFGLGGTPGTLIVNLKTGKYSTIEGAYPYDTFTQEIDALMKN